MRLKILLTFVLLLLALESGSAVYELCDSIERDSNAGSFRCNITTTRYRFSQQDIDGFWENMLEDGDYMHNRIKTVEWKIRQTVVQIADDLHFIQAEGMDLNWDIVLLGDINTTHDINSSLVDGVPRPTNHTAIKKRMGAMQEYRLFFAPTGERKSLRNITLERPEGAFAVYISGSPIKKMQIDATGDINLTGAYIENVGLLKAKNIYLEDSYLSGIDSIEAENISMEEASFIRNLGRFGEKAIVLKNGSTGLSLEDNSYIDNVNGGIEVEAAITLENNCRIENAGHTPSEALQWLHAGSLTMTEGSSIRGIGGRPGEITITGAMTLDNSFVAGKETYRPVSISAKSIDLNNSDLADFTETIDVTGKETFKLEGGSTIKQFSGTINSCAQLSMDGNTTRIIFAEDSEKIIRARGIDLNNGAQISCTGEEDCNYSFEEQTCSSIPSASLETVGLTRGNRPLTVEFSGMCDGKGTPVTCLINFGDGSGEEVFDGNVTHTYTAVGVFTAALTATNADDWTVTSEKTVVVTEPGAPPGQVVQVSVSKQSVERGGEIALNIECSTGFQTFAVENDFGLPAITSLPSCPASLGPFTIPVDTAEGSHRFTVSGITSGGIPFRQTVSFTVEGAAFPANLIELLFSYWPLLLLPIIAVAAFIILKKKGLLKRLRKPAAKPAKGKEKKEDVATEEKPVARLAEGEKPPWLVEEEAEAAELSETPKPEEKPAPPEKPPAKPEEKPAQPQEPEEKAPKPERPQAMPEERPDAQALGGPAKPVPKPAAPKPAGKPMPKPEAKPLGGPASPEGKGPSKPVNAEQADKFKNLVEMLKESDQRQATPKKGTVAKGQVPAAKPAKKGFSLPKLKKPWGKKKQAKEEDKELPTWLKKGSEGQE